MSLFLNEARTDPFTKVNGKQVATVFITVKAPKSLGPLPISDEADPQWGYSSYIHYCIKDNFDTILPSQVPENENFTGPIQNNYVGSDWTRRQPNGLLVNPNDFMDHIGGQASPCNPTPVGPTDQNAGTKVDHWPGTESVGSTNCGSGVTVQTATWQKYLGYARHE